MADPRLPSKISMVLLGVGELARSIAFYQTTIELPMVHSFPGFAFFSAGPITLVLSEEMGRAVHPHAGAMEVIFAVANVKASRALLSERGCVFLNEAREVTTGSWATTLTDPDGHRLTLFGPE